MNYKFRDYTKKRYIWFAWRPVFTVDNEIVWLEKVETIPLEFFGCHYKRIMK